MIARHREPTPRASVLDLENSRTVGDAMTRSLITTGPTVRLSSAVRLLRYHGVSGLPVVRGTSLVGVLSEKDILRAFLQHGGTAEAGGFLDDMVLRSPSAQGRGRWLQLLSGVRVSDVMTSPPQTVDPSTTIDAALRFMLLQHVHRVPVVDGAHLVGILTRGDVLKTVEGTPPGSTRAPAAVASTGP